MDKRKEVNRIVRESLAEALIYYMKIKPFGEITVTEIITKAGVARATYYRNFESKEELAREYISSLANEFARNHVAYGAIDSYETIAHLLNYIDEHKDILTMYAKAGLADLIVDSLTDVSMYKIDKELYKTLDEDTFTIFIGGLYAFVRKWMLDGAKTPPESVARAFYNVWHNR